MPINLTRGPKHDPPTLTTYILDGLAVAFSIFLFIWATHHVIFDFLASGRFKTMFF
jgi:hypothetical protein